MKKIVTIAAAVIGTVATAQTPSLEDRYRDGLCLGRWNVTETTSIATTIRIEVLNDHKSTETATQTIPGSVHEGARDRSVAGAYKKLQAVCNAHATNIVNAQANRHSPSMRIENSHEIRHRAGGTLNPRTEYSFRGTCTGTYKEDIEKTNSIWELQSNNTTNSRGSQTTTTKVGVSKRDAQLNPASLIENSIKSHEGRTVSNNDQARRKTQTTTVTTYNAPVFGTCTSADHIVPNDLTAKANFLLNQVENMEARNLNLCTNPEFKAVQGALWHVRLQDVQNMVLSNDVRKKIEAKVVEYPECVLDGDPQPDFIDDFDF